MKVIRKSDMLRSSQEGHLRAERDFLVSCEGSSWVVPLVASFDDLSNLYLVMEYMPGGDFLGLLIRENILHEAVACFYIAEMILAVEEAHRLGFIHRDIKPDNFLISSSGHLKISDFGLAFDGQWPHDASYYNYHRYSLLRKLNLDAQGDEKDQEDNKGIQGRAEKARVLMGDIERHDEQSLESDQDLATLLEWRHRRGNPGNKDTDGQIRPNVTPPFIPHINSLEDTHYFNESEPLDDRIESVTEKPGLTDEEVRWILRGYGALRSRDLEIDSMSAFEDEEKELLKRFVREYGRKVPKRPRDIILRDEHMKDTAMAVRKQSAFMGYAWHSVRRMTY
ncbi:hypothetical protein ACSS6W_006951 [Trichoderma asperelloides]